MKKRELFDVFLVPDFYCLGDKIVYIDRELVKYGTPVRVATDFGRTYEKCTMDILHNWQKENIQSLVDFYNRLEKMIGSDVELPLHVQSACYNPHYATPAVKFMR